MTDVRGKSSTRVGAVRLRDLGRRRAHVLAEYADEVDALYRES